MKKEHNLEKITFELILCKAQYIIPQVRYAIFHSWSQLLLHVSGPKEAYVTLLEPVLAAGIRA